ncbi:hypothetical protein BDN70DRAFT_900264 [Pholiota conissans]|uniref:Uncharacterized protein n=1 Tax=Pholiota conissans TaxID=109636 RepID=A0A9P5YNZ4_9AGAR|nr:hypothetical protein BDN70DRAFT_900264 [Pholiota conissans]
MHGTSMWLEGHVNWVGESIFTAESTGSRGHDGEGAWNGSPVTAERMREHWHTTREGLGELADVLGWLWDIPGEFPTYSGLPQSRSWCCQILEIFEATGTILRDGGVNRVAEGNDSSDGSSLLLTSISQLTGPPYGSREKLNLKDMQMSPLKINNN